MIKNLILLIVILFFLSACVKINFGKTDFDYKKECSNYSINEQKRMSLERESKKGINILKGIFYSKKLETCVAEWFIYNFGESDLDEMYLFHDVLTERDIEDFSTLDNDIEPPLQQNLQKKVSNYEQEIELIK